MTEIVTTESLGVMTGQQIADARSFNYKIFLKFGFSSKTLVFTL